MSNIKVILTPGQVSILETMFESGCKSIYCNDCPLHGLCRFCKDIGTDQPNPVASFILEASK